MIIDVREHLLDAIEVEIFEILTTRDQSTKESRLFFRRVNDRIIRIKDNIGFPKAKQNDKDIRQNDKDIRHNN